MIMPLKRQDENGKPVALVWTDSKCFAKEYHPESSKRSRRNLPDCDGVMVLKDIEIKSGSFKTGSEEGQIYHEHRDPYLEKIWVCSKCGFVFPE